MERHMAEPEVPIAVDPKSGIWSTDGSPMIYMPRHFFVNYYSAMDEALGRDRHAAMLFAASHKSAVQWMGGEARTHGIRDVDVFRHYLKRMSQRGWGQFTIDSVDLDVPTAQVRVSNSAFGLQLGKTGRRECAMFAGSFAGGLEWAVADTGRAVAVTSEETQCISEGHDHCAFVVRRA